MREQNNSNDESNNLQNQFTAYLITAVRRRKIQYLRSKNNYNNFSDLNFEKQEQYTPNSIEVDMLADLPLLEQLENLKLRQSLKNAKERELHIFLAKAVEGRSFASISAELGIGYKTTASIYYRLISRLVKELGGEDK
jgi:DNA-directed RNA polymerase specialized sigma24 family protein